MSAHSWLSRFMNDRYHSSPASRRQKEKHATKGLRPHEARSILARINDYYESFYKKEAPVVEPPKEEPKGHVPEKGYSRAKEKASWHDEWEPGSPEGDR